MPTMKATQRSKERRTEYWYGVFQRQLQRWFDLQSVYHSGDGSVILFVQPCQVQVIKDTFLELEFTEVSVR